jgi:allantoin racemase
VRVHRGDSVRQRRILLVNPNTSVQITERLARSARAQLPEGVELTAITAIEGPAVVRSPSELSAAAERVRHMAAAQMADHDAAIVGISLDCGLVATRAAWMPRPVLGMTESACHMACTAGPRFVLLTVGAAMADSYRAHVSQIGLADRLAGVAAPDVPEAFSAAPQDVLPGVIDALAQAAARVRASDVGSVVLAGAVLCGYAPALSLRLGLPVYDGVACAVQLVCARWALDMAD